MARTICLRTASARSAVRTPTSTSKQAESKPFTLLHRFEPLAELAVRFIWLVPIFTTDTARAATSFDVLIQSYEDPKLNDLARRAGGDFRYVVPCADRKVSDKIIEVGILRADKPLARPPAGWHGYSVNDLNKGRKKGCLYVVWKTASTGSWYVMCTANGMDRLTLSPHRSFVSLPGAIAWSRSGSGSPKFIKSLKVSPFVRMSTFVLTELLRCATETLSTMHPKTLFPSSTVRAPTSTITLAASKLNIGHLGPRATSDYVCFRYVWLVPEYTTDPTAAATSFDVSIQRIADLALDDVAKGAHRGYRYVLPKRDTCTKAKVKEVQLLRSDSATASPPSGWSGMTKDVNEGRGRSHVYLIWKSGA